jgi:hypothetical protein
MVVLQERIFVSRIARLPLVPHRGGKVNPSYGTRQYDLESEEQEKSALSGSVTLDFSKCVRKWNDAQQV